MTLQDVEAFVAVVDSGSVVGASAKLHLSQPAVTRRLQALEESLGETLLDRTTKPQVPTAAGKKAYTLARRVLSSVEDLRHSFGTEIDTGEFRFGSTPRITDLALIDAVASLRTAYPRLTLHASTGWASDLIEQVRDGRLDAAAMTAPDFIPEESGLVVKPIGSQTACVIAPKDHPVGSKVSLAALAEHPWVLNNNGCSMRGLLQTAYRAKGLSVRIAVEATGSELQIGLVAKGAGLGLITEEMLAKTPHKNAVRAVEVKDFKPKLLSCLVHKPMPERLEGPLGVLTQALERALPPVR